MLRHVPLFSFFFKKWVYHTQTFLEAPHHNFTAKVQQVRHTLEENLATFASNIPNLQGKRDMMDLLPASSCFEHFESYCWFLKWG